MGHTYTATVSTTINAEASQVWDALTNPAQIKRYFFGTNVISEWTVGSPIVFTGEWEGKPYEDKGVIVKNEPNRCFEYTYWSSFSGKPDAAENYSKITYQLEPKERQTVLTITQDKMASADVCAHSEKNWGVIVDGLKKILEG